MDILESFFLENGDRKEVPIMEEVEENQEEVVDESGSDEEEPAMKLARLCQMEAAHRELVNMRYRNRTERGKFTILDGVEVAEPQEILQMTFTFDLIQKIFTDSRVGIAKKSPCNITFAHIHFKKQRSLMLNICTQASVVQTERETADWIRKHLANLKAETIMFDTKIQFLARYGIIPNTRECKVESCPKDQLMSLIKHANGYVWRCRSCRKRRERRVITKISVYEGTFLFYSRMPMNKFFVFMLIWAENPGYNAAEYNKLLGEYRLVEETIHNTIGFIRDHIQSWCQLRAARGAIGGPGCTVELLETLNTEDVTSKHRNRKDRHFTTKLLLICYETNELSICNVSESEFNRELLETALYNNAREKSRIIMKDSLMTKFGDQEEIQNMFSGNYTVQTIADVWLTFDEDEKDRQFIKTLMESVTGSLPEPFGYEYYFRRCFMEKPFNYLLKAIREIYESN